MTKADTKSKINFQGINLTQLLTFIVAVGLAFYIGQMSAQLKFYKEGVGLPRNNNAAQPTQPSAPPEPVVGKNENLPKPSADDHIRGNEDARYALIEYSDFDCPFCGRFHPTAQQAVEELDIMWVYRHFPLSIHPEADEKAIASECVYNLGGDDAFWEFSDILFEDTPALSDLEDIVSNELGLSASAFTDCFENRETEDRVNKDFDEGSKAGVTGTPGNYLMDLETGDVVVLRGAVPFETVRSSLELLK